MHFDPMAYDWLVKLVLYDESHNVYFLWVIQELTKKLQIFVNVYSKTHGDQ